MHALTMSLYLIVFGIVPKSSINDTPDPLSYMGKSLASSIY